MRVLFGVLLFLGLFSCSCHTLATSPEQMNKDSLRRMDTLEIARYRTTLTWFFDSLLNSKGFSGGILVAKNGEILYEHYQGNAYGSQETPIDERTPFHVASTSKTFTSTAILQLESKGLLKLTDSLTVYWPTFPYSNVTIRDLLSHSSGIPDYANYFTKYGWNNKEAATNYDALDYLIKFKPRQDFVPGTRFRYCNTNFVLLALIVEKVTGLTFPYYIKENIFNLAGMEDSYVLTALSKGEYMPSWNWNGRMYNFDYLDGLYGDKNVYTTCRDLMKFDNAIRSGILLDSIFFNKAMLPYFKDPRHNQPWEYYGLGWRLKLFDNNSMIAYHNGWWHGNNAVFQRLISDTAVIIVTGNRRNDKIYSSGRVANLFRPYYPDNIFPNMEEAAGIEGETGKEVPAGEKSNEDGDLLKTPSSEALQTLPVPKKPAGSQ